jgi:tetratricopeptide (TPR) repeat protein
MAASDDYSGPLRPPLPHSELQPREKKQRGISQIDFEIDFFSQILERDPHHVDILRALADNLARKHEIGRALALDRRMVRLRPDRPVPWYDLACSYSLLGLIGPALHALGQAIELGYRRPDWILRDPDLRAVRRDPRFASLARNLDVLSSF